MSTPAERDTEIRQVARLRRGILVVGTAGALAASTLIGLTVQAAHAAGRHHDDHGQRDGARHQDDNGAQPALAGPGSGPPVARSNGS